MLVQELDKPIQERYLHLIVSRDNGMHLIFTFVPSLLKLIHDSPAGEGDIQYKRVENLFNEYEFVTYLPDIQHSESDSPSVWQAPANSPLGVTIGRIYTNRHDTEHYKIMFNKIQRLILVLTGKPMRFKRLSPGGNLLVWNTDMEAAAVLGLCQSFLPTNVLSYSGIPSDVTAEQLACYFVCLCLGHGKR
jgi:hypothetical protein